VAAALALLASLVWGTADFLGGTATRRLPVRAVVVTSQAFAILPLLVIAAALGDFGARPSYLPWAVAAGLVGVVALMAFYLALAIGTMGVVAPLAALGVVVPVLVGIAQGDRPDAAQAVGFAAAVVGVVLAGGPHLRARNATATSVNPELAIAASSARPIVLALVAAVGFGTVIVCVAHGAKHGTVMMLLSMRVCSVAALTALTLLGSRAVARLRPPKDALVMLAAIGGCDVGANALFAVASTRGLLSVVAVLSSLYPAVTVVLARWLHTERLTRTQSAGVLAALAGVVLIASGGGAAG
jgi:drug/metabolite transporter (DMT)-like permease